MTTKTYSALTFEDLSVREKEDQVFARTTDGKVAYRVLNSLTIDGPLEVIISEIDDFDIRNIITVANTEISVNITAGTKRFEIVTRGSSVIKLRKTSGGSYKTIGPRMMWSEDQLNLVVGLTIILETSDSDILEIIEWY